MGNFLRLPYNSNQVHLMLNDSAIRFIRVAGPSSCCHLAVAMETSRSNTWQTNCAGKLRNAIASTWNFSSHEVNLSA